MALIGNWVRRQSFALAAARALMTACAGLEAEEVARRAMEIAADICIYTNRNPDVWKRM